jgi:hypothetical protein
MAAGRNDILEILGRQLHVQTEVTAGYSPKLRTTVYVEGRVIGTREAELNDEDAPQEMVRRQLNDQHEQIISNLLTRAEELQEERRRALSGEPVGPQRSVPPKLSEARVERPDPEATGRLATSIRTRQLVGAFSDAIDRTPWRDGDELRMRLNATAEIIDQAMASATFPDIRLDEQVRFFDLRERIAAWRSGGRRAGIAEETWLEIFAFAAHLDKVNNRSELVEFDYRLLTWALYAVGRDGVTPEILGHLGSLGGRDRNLDQLLASDQEVDRAALVEVLMFLLERTLPEGL